MLNWDDPLAAAKPQPRKAPPRIDAAVVDQSDNDFELPATVGRLHAHSTDGHVRPGQGVVANEALMSTAGAAPVVNPIRCRHNSRCSTSRSRVLPSARNRQRQPTTTPKAA